MPPNALNKRHNVNAVSCVRGGLVCALSIIAFHLYSAVISKAQADDAIVIATHDVRPIRGFPHTATDWVSSRFWPLLFDALTEVDEGGRAAPALAERWTAQDEKTWIFELRRGVRFSNGEPLDAFAVVETLNYLRSSAAVDLAAARYISNVTGVERIDDHRVMIRTAYPDAMLPARLRTFRILPPRYFAEAGRTEFALRPHGTGPYMAQALKVGRSEFIENPYAWRKPKTPRIDFVQVGDALARAQGVVSGSIDIALNTGPSVIDFVSRAGARLVSTEIGSVDAVPFVLVASGPFQNDPLQSPLVRRALNFAVNKQALIQAFIGGATTPATQFAPPGTVGYKIDVAPPFPYDPAKARTLLAEAGYPDGFETAIEVWIDSADQAAVYQQIAIDLTAVGVRTKIVNVPILEWQNEGLYGGRWKAPMFNFGYNALPSFDALDSLVTHSCLWVTPFTCDQALTDRVLDAQRTFDADARLAKTHSIFAVLNADPRAILLFPSVRFDVTAAHVGSYRAPYGLIRYEDLFKNAD